MERPLSERRKFVIEDATENDFSEIHKIYSHYVLNSTISLEEIPPTKDEMILRWKNSREKFLPYIVAKVGGEVAGYAYAFAYRPRSAYRFTVEESVYIAENFAGFGLGRALLSELITRCQEKNYRQMLAVITGDEASVSVKFHEKMGFKKSGVLEKFGFKFGQWIDTVLMQREL